MNLTWIGFGGAVCLLAMVAVQDKRIDNLKKDIVVIEAENKSLEEKNKDLAGQNGALLVHIRDITVLEKKLDEFEANQKKRTAALKSDIRNSMADDNCAPQSVPAGTVRMQQEDIQRANDEIRAMFTP